MHSFFLVAWTLGVIAGALATILKYERLGEEDKERNFVLGDFVELPYQL